MANTYRPSNQITNWTKEWTVDGVRVEVGARTVLIAFWSTG